MELKIADYAPSPTRVIRKMLEYSKISKGDILYDIGSGTGRIVIEAAKNYGVKSRGVEIDPNLVEISRGRIKEQGLDHLIEIVNGDVLDVGLSEADVVTAYLSPVGMDCIESKIFTELKTTARFVSHDYGFPNYCPSESHFIWAKSFSFPWTPFPVGHFIEVYKMDNVRKRKSILHRSKGSVGRSENG